MKENKQTSLRFLHPQNLTASPLALQWHRTSHPHQEPSITSTCFFQLSETKKTAPHT